ncbi:hypothetical protein CH333_05570 [candidate division WOR-3 bacterium JGI_Cruoil_03_44_89]|uniref:NodB homology domain-containing protein n=1 Tax=candidate division WOR-3 bacterium JGI_Cruoil_03_44_89 TaxID=1973748 RepID=A0A235BUP5_UNCW3|nr:MAG: hypothetical protein CH333_05570 [candidate division WOR-3 bacterium JGI_Cruoil_03_44_89]
MRILSQEGIPIDPKSDIWIVDRKTPGIMEFLKSGGFVLTTLKYVDGEIKRRLRQVKKGSFGYFSGEIGQGYIIALAFDPGYYSFKRKRKSFYSDYGRPPDEAVSYIGTGGVRRTAIDCLGQLFCRKGIPYVHKWYYPKGESLFALRIDTDFSTAREVLNLQESLQNMGFRATFFLNVLVLKNDLHDILNGNHSFGIHCYRHTVYPDRKRNYENIKMAKKLVENEGVRPKGFAAPYGIWHKKLSEILGELGFSYSSEFSYSYDDLPFFPDHKTNILQIPIHPICMQRLFMSRHTKKGVRDYFTSLIDRNSLMGEPTIIYGHPDVLAKNLDTLKEIIDYAREKEGVWFTDMDEIDDWWRKRESMQLSAIVDGNTMSFGETIPVPIEIVLPDGRHTICNVDGSLELSKLPFCPPHSSPPLNEPRGNGLWLFLRELESMFFRIRNRRKEQNFLDIG